jgi:hypothetical protein
MNINKNLLIALTIIGGALAYSSANAAIIELVENGEFENPNVGNWGTPSNSSVPGWTNSSGNMEIFGQGAHGSPTTGSDGLDTGQHHEVARNNATNFTTQALSIAADGYIDFSFDAWKRGSTGISYSLVGTTSGSLVAGTHSFSGNAWENISFADLFVSSGESLTLRFDSNGGSTAGAHIDQVSLAFEAVPEPSIIALFGLGLVGIGFARRRRS